MNPIEPPNIYQLRIYVKGISPMIWRRIFVRGDTSIADLHEIMQVLMDWYDVHLHHFLIRGKRYGVSRIGTMGFMDDARRITLDQFRFRLNEAFVYEYNYFNEWQLKIRVESRAAFEPNGSYPYCAGGKRSAPPEEYGGPWRFMELKQHYSLLYILDRLEAILSDPDLEETRWDYADEFQRLQYWLYIDRFDRRRVNQKLQELFAAQVEEKTDEDSYPDRG